MTRGQRAWSPTRAAVTLLGAPLLAVVATFWLQPKASGLEASARVEVAHATQASVPRTSLASTETVPRQEREPFDRIAQAIDAHELNHARELLALTKPSQASSALDRQLWQAYALMVDCLQAPSNDLTADAYRFYLEQAPASARPRLRQACLPDD